MTITPEEREALDQMGAIRVEDPDTHTEYVVLKADAYDRMRTLVDETRSAYPLAMKVFGEAGWDDPQMDGYNALDPRK